MGSTRVVTTCLLALVLASSLFGIAQSCRPAPEDGINGKSGFNLTQTENPAYQEVLQQYGSSLVFERTSRYVTEIPMGIFQYLSMPVVHAIVSTCHKEQAINLQRDKQGGSDIGPGRHLNEFGFQFFSSPPTSDDSNANDISSSGHRNIAWDLRPIIRDMLGVFIVLVALATCMHKRDGTGGATVEHQHRIWKETGDQHWAHMQAHGEYRVVPHWPTYVSAPAAGQITRVWARARANMAVLQNQPLFLLAVDGGDPLVISAPAPGCLREVAVTVGMRVAKDSWLAALDTQHPSHHGAMPVVDPAHTDHPVAHPGAYPAHPVAHPGAYPPQPAQPVVHPGAHPPQPAHPVVHPAQRAHRVVHPRAWSSSTQPHLPVVHHAQPAQHAQDAGPSSPRYAVRLARSCSI